ncbi:MAG: DUF445 family protein [Clostridia bacterium]|nr:DUF445 family protein [Clostridia bacterium]
MELLQIISGPLVGGAIGYFTNYIAIRMLFRPAKAVYIGRFRLPFTPGIVPRRKDELAGILGRAVVARFFNSDDLQEVFAGEGFRDAVAASVTDALFDGGGAAGLRETAPEAMAALRENLVAELSFRIRAAILRADLPKLAAEKGGQFIRNSLGELAAARFLTDDMIAKLAEPVGRQLERYVASDGRAVIRALVESELDALLQRPAGALLQDLKLERETLRALLARLYEGFIRENAGRIAAPVDISAQIEKKVKDMSPLELEGLVLSVVKRELNGVVLLGALLGFLIGIINIFI